MITLSLIDYRLLGLLLYEPKYFNRLSLSFVIASLFWWRRWKNMLNSREMGSHMDSEK
jgi:hypothetical protein